MKFSWIPSALFISLLLCCGCQSDSIEQQQIKQQEATSTAADEKRTGGGDKNQSAKESGEAAETKEGDNPQQGASEDSAENRSAPILLFDGKTLQGWKITEFGAESVCKVEDENIVVEMGYPMNGLTSTLDNLPKIDYELSLEAKRVDGIDFFCGVTFPYKDSHCSLIVGGWAGSTVGLSCVDGKDASDNETKKMMSFDDDRWYRVRIRAVANNISCWIDDEQIVDLDTEGREISLRNDSGPTRPLSIYTFQTTAAYRKIQIQKLASGETLEDGGEPESKSPDASSDSKQENGAG